MTVEEFAEYNFPEGKVELVRGEPRVMSPAGAPHAAVGSNLLRLLLPFVSQHKLGWVFGDGLGYELIALPHTVRNPDASFVRADRLPAEGFRRGFLKMAPDLAVEVLSPSETASLLEEKLGDYRAAGTPLIWVIDPDRRTVMIVSGDAPLRGIRGDETLDGGDVVPGFRCRVVELFEGLA
jgi:Uma2 family endonuclease